MRVIDALSMAVFRFLFIALFTKLLMIKQPTELVEDFRHRKCLLSQKIVFVSDISGISTILQRTSSNLTRNVMYHCDFH